MIAANDFDSGLLSCMSGHKAGKKTAFACCCAPVRLAANASATGCMDYWSIVIMASFFLPFIFIIGYIHRLHIRNMFGMEPHPVGDFFQWLCCCCCALVQESKFIDRGFESIKNGTRMVFVTTPTFRPP
jgi:Cys-rich protein (TIGR01571 family)